jgi:NADH-quinone oxidoreductase subunit J
MVLFLFVIMMLNMGQHSIDQERSWMGPKIWIVPSILASVLLAQLLTVITQYDHELALTTVDVMEVSALLFGPYVLAVELASILLLAGLVAAYHLAKK